MVPLAALRSHQTDHTLPRRARAPGWNHNITPLMPPLRSPAAQLSQDPTCLLTPPQPQG